MTSSLSVPDFLSTHVGRSHYYFGVFEENSSETLTVACAGREECTPDYHLLREGFRFHAVEYIHSGQILLSAGECEQVLGPGSVFSYAPETHFILKAVGNDPLIKYFVDLGGQDAGHLLASSGLQVGSPGSLFPSRWAHDLFEQLIHCGVLPEPEGQEIACQLGRLLIKRIALDTRQPPTPQSERYHTFQRCLLYIRDHFKELKELDTLCQACRLDRAYLSRLFKEYGEDSPYRVLIRCKMDYAAGLLRYQQVSVKAAAAEVGFEDPYHFSRVFKKYAGISPGQFRKGSG